MKGRRQTFLTKFLKVKIFAGTRIRTHNLPAQSFFIRAEPFSQALAPSGLHSQVPISSYLGDLAVAARTTVSFISNQTQSVYIQCPSA